jgi:hypothetical protein
MSREVRRVPANWKHPTDGHYRDGSVRYVSLFPGEDFEPRLREWQDGKAKWDRGEFPDYADAENRAKSYEEWDGDAPRAEHYMPNWPESERTHLMMYETCSEGSPISPAFGTPEEVARWCADNGASAFGSMTATYEQWLRVANGGFAPSAVLDAKGFRSGVEAMSD